MKIVRIFSNTDTHRHTCTHTLGNNKKRGHKFDREQEGRDIWYSWKEEREEGK